VENCELIDDDAARRLEPQLSCVAALHSRETGIVDSHALMLALLGDLEAAGGTLACATPFERAAREDSVWIVHTGGEAPFALAADVIVNAAGLQAQEVAAQIEPLPAAHIPRRHPRPRLLLPARRPGAVFAADLPGAGARRARRAPDPRPRRAGALRSRCRMGRCDRLHRRCAPCRRVLRRGARVLAGSCPRRRSRPPTPASGRSSAARASRRRTSSSPGRPRTACLGW
jgi:hypothetical protein